MSRKNSERGRVGCGPLVSPSLLLFPLAFSLRATLNYLNAWNWLEINKAPRCLIENYGMQYIFGWWSRLRHVVWRHSAFVFLWLFHKSRNNFTDEFWLWKSENRDRSKFVLLHCRWVLSVMSGRTFFKEDYMRLSLAFFQSKTCLFSGNIFEFTFNTTWSALNGVYRPKFKGRML